MSRAKHTPLSNVIPVWGIWDGDRGAVGHCTGSSHRIGDERAPTASTANRGSADAKRSKTTGPRGRREGSHEALVHFCHYPQPNHCGTCLQNVCRRRLIPAPALVQATVLSPLDYGSNFLMGLPACTPRLRFPPLVISSWALIIGTKVPMLPLCISPAQVSPLNARPLYSTSCSAGPPDA